MEVILNDEEYKSEKIFVFNSLDNSYGCKSNTIQIDEYKKEKKSLLEKFINILEILTKTAYVLLIASIPLIPILFIALLTVVEIVIQFVNDNGINNLLIDDVLLVIDIIITIVFLNYNFKNYGLFFAFLIITILSYLINLIIFLKMFIGKYRKSQHIYNFFISFCIIKSFLLCLAIALSIFAFIKIKNACVETRNK